VSLTVSCLSCRDDANPRRIVSWAQSCQDCADLCVANHLADFPEHQVEVTGRASDTRTPPGASRQVLRLFGTTRNGW
jgi:hypothetical protein